MPTKSNIIRKIDKLDINDIIEVSEIKYLLLNENKNDLLKIFDMVIKMANKKLNIAEDKT